MSASKRLTGKDAPLSKRQQKLVVNVRRAKLMYLERNEDGTFDIDYVAQQEKEPARLKAELAATIPKNGMAYWENIGGIAYAFVCDKKTGEHLGLVCDCGFKGFTEANRCPCR